MPSWMWKVAIALAIVTPIAVRSADPTPVETLLKALGKEGSGNREAALAWRTVVDAGTPSLIPLLTALDTATPVSANWIRTAIDALVEKSKTLPLAEVEEFLFETKHSPLSRRLAFEILTTADPKIKESLLDGMIDDPSVEIRREAIAQAIEKAKTINAKPTALKEFTKLFVAARDLDQVLELEKQVKTFGGETNMVEHFNFITEWQVLGPFDNVGGAGFAKTFDPEKKVDLTAPYTSKEDKPIKWKSITTTDKFAVVDLNKEVGKFKGATAYAYAVIEVEKEQPIEVRLGCITALQVFLNGERIFSKEEYHHGEKMDQYVGKGKLKAGRNELLIKVCQNEQTESWAQTWTFQARICDATGGKIPMKVTR